MSDVQHAQDLMAVLTMGWSGCVMQQPLKQLFLGLQGGTGGHTHPDAPNSCDLKRGCKSPLRP